MKAGLRTAHKDHAAEAAARHAPARARPAAAPTRQLQPELGNQAVQWLFKTGALHAKLAVGSPDDPLEREADQVAAHVMRAPASSLQRKCACEGPSGANGECEECRSKRMEGASQTTIVQRRPKTNGGPHEAPSIVHDTLGGAGQPLDPATRADMEGRFGRHFGDVRIHADHRAGKSAAAIDALAYTASSHIVFGQGRYAPQTDAGGHLLAHELAHVLQQSAAGDRSSTVQRQTDPPPPQPSPAPSPPQSAPTPPASAAPPQSTPPTPPDNAAPPPADPNSELIAQEGKAFDVAKGRVGQPAATVLFSNPNSAYTKDSPVFETFTVGEVMDRHTGDPIRSGFDTPGPATAYAAILGGDIGGAVLQQDKFYFGAKLNKGSRELRVTDPTISEWAWWAGRDHVYRVTASPGVVSVTGMGGFVFPLGKDLMDDPAKTRFLKDPDMATPADAQSMRDVAGVPPIGKEGQATGKRPDEVAIPDDQQEAFILSYFRSRGLEALSYNEEEAERLEGTFKATDSGSSTKDPSGVSDDAKKSIATDREQLKIYKKLLEEEVQVEALLSFLNVCEERGEFPPFYPIYVKPQKAQVTAMKAVIKARRDDIEERKFGLLAVSPLLSQLVGIPDPATRFAPPERIRGNLIERLEIPKIRGTSYTSVDENPLAKPETPENNENIRKQFLEKLDGIIKAIRDTRSEMLGDADFLLGMEGLRQLVIHDLGNATGKNAGLKDKLKQLLQAHATSEKTSREAGFVIQLGLLFIPGIGPLLSAAAGFVMSAAELSTALRRSTAAQASVNPAAALVDQKKAEAALAQSTIELAVNSVFVATEAINALKTMEASGGAAKLEGALKDLGEQESKASAENAVRYVEENPSVIENADKPGQRRAQVTGADGPHEIVEVPDAGELSGIHCELRSPPPFKVIHCPNGMGSLNPSAIAEGEAFAKQVGASSDPLIVRNLSPDAVKELVAKYDPGRTGMIAGELNRRGTVASFDALSEATRGFEGRYQAHHLVEVKVLEQFGFDTAKAPSVILTSAEHLPYSNELARLIDPQVLHDMTKKEIRDAYLKAYGGHPDWIQVVKWYFP